MLRNTRGHHSQGFKATMIRKSDKEKHANKRQGSHKTRDASWGARSGKDKTLRIARGHQAPRGFKATTRRKEQKKQHANKCQRSHKTRDALWQSWAARTEKAKCQETPQVTKTREASRQPRDAKSKKRNTPTNTSYHTTPGRLWSKHEAKSGKGQNTKKRKRSPRTPRLQGCHNTQEWKEQHANKIQNSCKTWDALRQSRGARAKKGKMLIKTRGH